jgi:predicted nucleic acid-binding protein
MGMKLGMSHFSNGNAKAPNLGVNLPFASVTLNRSIYFLRENKGLSKLKSDSIDKRWFISSRFGYKSVDVDDPRKLVVFVIEGGHAWNIKKHVWKTSVSVHSDPIYRFEKFQKMVNSLGLQITPIQPEDSASLASLRAKTSLKMPDVAVLRQARKVNGTVATTDQKLAQAAKDLGFGVFHPN